MKKILALIFVVTMLSSLFAVNVSASFYMEEDFSDGLPQFGIVYDPETGGTECFMEDGALVMNATDMSGGSFARGVDWTGTVETDNLIMQFDVKWDSWNALNNDMRILVYAFAGDGKRILHSFGPHKYWFNNGANTAMVDDTAMQDKEWYTITYCFKNDRTMVDVYRQKRDSGEAPVLLIGDIAAGEINMPDQRLNIYMPKGASARFDNFRFFSGTFLEEGEFTMDGEEISKTEQLSEGVLKAEAALVYSDAEHDGEKMKNAEATLALVAYNKDGRMISCKYTSGIELICGKQDIGIEVDTTTFRGSAEGGYVGFYIIDSLEGLQPLTNRIEL